MGENPIAWARWLEKKGYAIARPGRGSSTAGRRRGPSGRTAGTSPAPLAIPAEHHDTSFMVDQVIEHLSGARRRAVVRAPLAATGRTRRGSRPSRTTRSTTRRRCPASCARRARSARASSTRGCASTSTRDYFRAPEDERKLRRYKASYFGLMTRGRRPARPALRVARGAGALGLDARRLHLRPRRADGRPLDAREERLLRAELPHPADRARPAAGERRDARRRSATPSPRTSTSRRRCSSGSAPRSPPACDGRSLLPFLATARAPEGWRREAHFEYDFREVQGGAPERALGLRAPRVRARACCATSAASTSTSPGCPPLFFDLERDPGGAPRPRRATRPTRRACSSTRSACSPGAWRTTSRR